MTRKHRIIIWAAATLAAIVLALGAAGWYLLDVALKPAPRGRDLPAAWAYLHDNYPHMRLWIDCVRNHRALRDTFVTSPADGARLHGYYMPATRPTPRTALLVHGYTDNALRMLMIGYLYQHDLGYNIILPDLRNAGLSDGDHFQMGWFDRHDVRQWIDVARKLYSDSVRMVVHGISMGAATTMMLSGDSLPGCVRAFVADCGYTSVWDEFGGELHNRYGLPEFPLLYVASGLCRLRYGWSFSEASALRQVARCHRPMLFIHGTADTFVPYWMMDVLYAAKPAPKQKWAVPGVEHARSYQAFPREYTRRVARFLTPVM